MCVFSRKKGLSREDTVLPRVQAGDIFSLCRLGPRALEGGSFVSLGLELVMIEPFRVFVSRASK